MKYSLFVALLVIIHHIQCEFLEETKSAVSLANNDFALDLLKNLPIKKRNHFFSSFSMSIAFAMLALGAKKNTLKEIKQTLHFDEIDKVSGDEIAFHKIFQEILRVYEMGNETMDCASRLFIQENFEILDQFLEATEENYNTSVAKLDFGSGEAENIINRWIERQTHEKIKQFYPPKTFTTQTIMAMVNAIYFNGEWVKKFDESRTTDRLFYTNKKKSYKVKMMKTTDDFPYSEDTDLKIKAIKLPYAGDHLSMLIILPEEGHLADLIPQLTTSKLKSILQAMKFRKFTVLLPKFKLETNYSLKKILRKLKLKAVFTNKADLSGIAHAALYVSTVDHKAVVEVNEKGTEAAAVSGIGINFRASELPQPMQFIVNRPFFFTIIDNRYDNLMTFTGTVIKPT